MVNREGIVEKNHVIQRASGSKGAELGQDVFVASATSVRGPSEFRIKLIVHAGGAVGTWERAAALRGHMHDAPAFVEQVTGRKWNAVDGLDRRANLRARLALDPNVVDAAYRRMTARFENLNELEQGRFAFAEAHVVDADVVQHFFRRERRMEAAQNDGHIEAFAQLFEQGAGTKPLPRGCRYANEPGPKPPNGGLDVGDAHFHADSKQRAFVSVRAQHAAEKSWPEGCHRPRTFGIDLKKQHSHRATLPGSGGLASAVHPAIRRSSGMRVSKGCATFSARRAV